MMEWQIGSDISYYFCIEQCCCCKDRQSNNLKGIDWVIVGGESGHTPRPMNEEWVIAIREQCQQAGVAFYFKQWGGTNKKKNGRLLEGKKYDMMPESILA